MMTEVFHDITAGVNFHLFNNVFGLVPDQHKDSKSNEEIDE